MLSIPHFVAVQMPQIYEKLDACQGRHPIGGLQMSAERIEEGHACEVDDSSSGMTLFEKVATGRILEARKEAVPTALERQLGSKSSLVRSWTTSSTRIG